MGVTREQDRLTESTSAS